MYVLSNPLSAGNTKKSVFSRSNEDLKDSSLRAFKVVIFQMPLMAFIMNATTLLVVWDGRKTGAGG